MLLYAIWHKISRHLQQTSITKLLAIDQLYTATVQVAVCNSSNAAWASVTQNLGSYDWLIRFFHESCLFLSFGPKCSAPKYQIRTQWIISLLQTPLGVLGASKQWSYLYLKNISADFWILAPPGEKSFFFKLKPDVTFIILHV